MPALAVASIGAKAFSFLQKWGAKRQLVSKNGTKKTLKERLQNGWNLLKKAGNAINKNRDLVETALGGNESSMVSTPIGTVLQSPDQASSNKNLLLLGGAALAGFLLLKK